MTMRVTRHLAAFFLTLFAVIGCGSGGGNSGPPPSSTETWTVTATAGEGGSVSPASQNVMPGETATVTVMPDEGWSIASITGCNGTLEGNVYTTGEITANCAVSASFTESTSQVVYSIHVSASPAQGGSIGGGGIYGHGHEVTVSATANDGYAFVEWTEDGTTVSTDTDYSFIAGSERTLVANFAERANATFTVTATAGEGGNISPTSATVNHGASTSFTVISNPGYSIASITGCNGAIDGATYTTGPMTADCHVTASFVALVPQYTIQASAMPTAGGSVNGGGTYAANATVTVQATPAPDYLFVNWIDAGTEASTSASYTFTATGDRDLVANFVPVPTYTIGGTLTGLAPGKSLVLQNNGGDDLTLSVNGAFVFALPVAEYDVTIKAQPEGQYCSIINDGPRTATSNVSDVQVECANVYTISGLVSGLSGTGLVLQNNGGDDLPIDSNGSFTFSTPLFQDDNYAVTVNAPPTGQQCTVENGTGTVTSSMAGVLVICQTLYSIDVSVEGLNNAGLVLRLNDETDFTVDESGTFTLGSFLDGTAYAVTVKTQPATDEICTVENGTGVVGAADVTDLIVDCFWTRYDADKRARAIATDPAGNVYVVGTTHYLKDWWDITTDTYGRYLTKRRPDNSLVYTREVKLTYPAVTTANAVATDAHGNVYVVGTTPGSGYQQEDFFLTKYNSSGTVVFTRTLGHLHGKTFGHGVAVDGSGNIYVTGTTEKRQWAYTPDPPTLGGQLIKGTSDMFLVKYNASGTRIYTKLLGEEGFGRVTGNAVTTDAGGNIYVVGSTTIALDGNAKIGNTDFFVTKYDSSGTSLFTKQWGASGATAPANSVAVDGWGNVYVAGTTNRAIDDNILVGIRSYFFARYTNSGLKVYTRQNTGNSLSTTGVSVATDSAGNVYVAGDTPGQKGYVLAKWDDQGNLLHTKVKTGLGSARADKTDVVTGGVAVDANDNAFIAVHVTDEYHRLDGSLREVDRESFVDKYDRDGVLH